MFIGITGASGFVGRPLVELALQRGHEVIAFTRSPQNQIPGCEMRPFSLTAPPDLSGCEAVIHLAGESVVGLWTRSKMQRILNSRVEGTRRIAEAFASMPSPPEVLVSGSAIGFYGNRLEEELTEDSPVGTGFLADTTALWEAEALRVKNARVVLARTSLVLGKKGGALKAMLPAFRAGLGGPIGNGQQWMSWIHETDQARLLLFAAENLEVRGPLNASAPWPVRNEEFTRELARTLRRPAFFRVPSWALRPLGEFRHELLDSKRVLPQSALAHGFGFQFPELAPALKHLLG
ncbi:MAG: hypothetical protein RLZZ253_315 [Verrucomicrobiota bacterium]|jgi:uncharacterized protein (TIGR01777 family)